MNNDNNRPRNAGNDERAAQGNRGSYTNARSTAAGGRTPGRVQESGDYAVRPGQSRGKPRYDGGRSGSAYPRDSRGTREAADSIRQPATSAYPDANEVEEGDETSEYLAGKHPVLEALKAGRALNKIWLSNQAQKNLVQPILEEAKTRGVVVQFADKRKLDSLVPDVQHQGVVAQAAAVSYAEPSDILARAAERGEAPLIVLLDEVEDPHNLGSILRSVDCTGAHGVIVPKRRSASLTAVVAKTSAGAVEYVPVARVSNLVQTIERLKEAGVWIAGADAAATSDVYAADLTGPIAIVIGSEGKGLSRLVREKCDFLISLPMFGQLNSLNASVAAGVILYEAVRQRQAKGKHAPS